MGVDLTTFLAQIFNLFLLVWLLKRFLYRPVLEMIDKRRLEITDTINAADKKLAEATKTEQELEKQKAALEEEHRQRMAELNKEFERQKKEFALKLAQERTEKMEKLQADLTHSWQTAETAIHQMVAEEFVALSKKVLTEWSDETPMDNVITMFEKKLYGMSKTKVFQIQQLLENASSILVVASEPLTKEQQSGMREILEDITDSHLKVRFKTNPELILGIEVYAGDFVLDWNLNIFLQEMEQRLNHNISDLIQPQKRKADK